MNPKRGVLLDTGPVYAVLVPRDQYHEQALELFESFDAEGMTVSVAYPALLETHRLLLTRAGRDVQRAHRSITGLLDVLAVQYPDAADGSAARTTLERFLDQPISLTDATVVAMSVRLGLQAATFDDRHFGLMGADVYQAEP